MTKCTHCGEETDRWELVPDPENQEKTLQKCSSCGEINAEDAGDGEQA